MSRLTKLLALAAAALAVWILLARLLAGALGLAGRDRGVLVLGLAFLGLVAAGAVVWSLVRRDRPAPGAPKGLGAAVDAGMRAAREALARAKGRKAAVPAMPAVLVLGPAGSAKTTTVVRSGLDPALLAGDLFRGETVAPTAAANLWLAGDVVIAEAGGPLAQDRGAYKRLLSHIRPRRLASAVQGKQPPRAAVVCYPCDTLLAPGGGEAARVTAVGLRAQLVDAARAFGVRLPVYLVLTKADAVAHFADFAHPLTASEADEVVGATFASDDGEAGTYADRTARRLGGALQELVESLGLHRLRMLPRDLDPTRRLGAYELPRELRKLAPRVVELAMELCRPTQEPTGPFLRGVYFTGVQAVLVQEAPRAEEAVAAAARAPAAVKATGVFSPAGFQTPAAAPAAPQAYTRKVPRWVWLTGLWKDVILADRPAQLASQGGVGLDLTRRALLGGAASLAMLLALLFTVSYAGNRRLQRDVADATRAINALPPSSVDLPSVDALRRLDSLRAQVQRLRAYDRDGAPLALRFGLYSGDDLLPEARRRYFAALDRLIVGASRASLLATLRGLPDAPTAADDYGRTYDALKAHLITTSQPRYSTPQFLTPALAGHWLGARTADSTRLALARRQLDFYATELLVGNPYPGEADAAAVARGRDFLSRFAGPDRVYTFMIAEASRANPPASLARRAPAATAFVSNAYEVPGAFTKGGWQFMQSAFKNVDRFFQGEKWVVGEQTGAPADRAKLVADLRARYASDFVKHWRAYLAAGGVPRYAGVKDAARRLGVLSGNQSPLLVMLAIASQNTAVPDTALASRFQPVQAVVSPAAADKLVAEANAPYVNALVGLQAAIDQAANAPPGQGELAAQQASQKASDAKVAVLQLAQGFRLDPEAHVEATVQRLLEAPITYVEPLLRGFGAAEINAAAGAFCGQARGVMNKFPFNASSPVQAGAAEVNALLRPGTGALWALTAGPLARAVQRQGAQFVPTGTVQLAPQFVAFLNRAAAMSEALYRDDTPDARMALTIQPLVDDVTSAMSITVDGQTVRSTRNSLEKARVAWAASSAREARLAAAIGRVETPLLGYTGTWALFQLLQQAETWRPVGDGYRVEWALVARGAGGAPESGALKVAAEIGLGGVNPAVFRKGFFGGTSCPSAPAR